MAESSWPWDGITVGDASAAPYSASEYAQFVRVTQNDGGSGAGFRLHIALSAFNYGALLVTGTATPVSIAAGYAQIAGYSYINDASTTLAIPTPAANPRIDRVVLRIDWAAQTIRLARLAGSEAATPSPPALTQTIGTTYEVSLAQVYITTGGVITVRDERVGTIGLGPETFFRDIRDRAFEEFFDNFTSPVTANVPVGWTSTVAGTGAITGVGQVPSTVRVSSGGTNGGSARLHRTTLYQNELTQAPLLFEMRALIGTAVDANGAILMRLIDSAGTSYCEFGMRGSVSTTNLMARNAAGGAATSFTTGQAVDTAAYHTYGLYVPASGGPLVVIYDGVPIGQVAAGIPASTTDMRAEVYADNGATSATRSIDIDWARLVRGTN